MGMFDLYEPDPPLVCGICQAALPEWQGKQGPNALLRWKQGRRIPGEGLSAEAAAEVRGRPFEEYEPLPDRFRFYAFCDAGHVTFAEGRCEGGVWRSSVVTESRDA